MVYYYHMILYDLLSSYIIYAIIRVTGVIYDIILVTNIIYDIYGVLLSYDIV